MDDREISRMFALEAIADRYVAERDTLSATLEKVKKLLASPEADIDPKGIVATLRLVMEGKL